ncbi:gp53-like domain-containing protein [Enterobacter roggenkampii]|uniref:gp53-like domain-containing protein n=1 Tax=Enterobacter roggenkampii TaxID=1812935 RepID=UPI000795147E|nr:hypothetical protein [Enterobacter roggenkampii]SAE80134.1 Uncharacterised protein [Enterobacter roggenkampii]
MRPLMPPVQTPDNLFHDGNPLTGELGTIVDAEHLNNVQGAVRDAQSELITVLNAAGINVDPSKQNQLLTALKALLLSRSNPFGDIKSDGTVKTALENLGFGERLLAASGYFELPGGLLLQWGGGSVQATNATVRFKKPFNVTPFIVLPHKITADNRYVTSVNYTLTGFSLYGWGVSGTASNIDSYTYFALGI